jgi:hypothetical protein
MLPATAAKLLLLQPLGHRFAVLGRRIVPLFAITALHRNNFSGHCSTPVSMQNEELRMQNFFCAYFFTSSFCYLLLHSDLLLLHP